MQTLTSTSDELGTNPTGPIAMTLFSSSCDAPRAPHLLFLLLTGMGVAVLGACDTTNLDATEDGPRDDAEVQVSDEPFERADLQYEPVSLAPGQTFSISLADVRHDRPVTRILHEGLPGGEKALRASFAPLNPSSVTVRCRNEMTGTVQTMAELDADELGLESGVQPVAKAKDDPDSYHYESTDDNTLVGVDYDEESKATAPTFNFPGTDEPAQCTHVMFVLHDVTTELTPNGVQFGGDVSAPSLRRKRVDRMKK